FSASHGLHMITPPPASSLFHSCISVFGRSPCANTNAQRSRNSAVALLLLTILAVGRPANAATYTWDADATPGNGTFGGTGTWDATTLNWFNGTTDVAWPNNTTTDPALAAFFGGTAGTVTVTSGTTINVNSITFATSGYTISGGGLNFGGSGSSTIRVNLGSATINSVISGILNSMTITGGGTLNLTASNTYTGATTINGATLSLGTTGAIQSGTLTLSAGEF